MGKAKYDPFLDEIRTRDIPQYTSDPATPKPEEAWVLRTIGGGGGTPVGLLLALTTAGSGSSYKFKYRTVEGTTVSVDLS